MTCNLLKAREKSGIQGAIGFDFASHWLKNWCEIFQPITKCSNRNYVITFDGHLKTALLTEDNPQSKKEGGGLERCQGLSPVMNM